MSDENLNHGQSGHEVEFEHEDLGTRGVYGFLIGLVVSGIVIYFIIMGMYKFLENYEESQMKAASPLAATSASARIVTQDDMDKAFKDNGAPMLETNERNQFGGFLMDQENRLNSYGWVDQNSGLAHIPIDHAMDLIVSRGMPVHSEGNLTGTTTLGTMGAATKSPDSKPVPAEKENSSAQ